MQTDEDPFRLAASPLARLPAVDARRILDVVAPLNLQQAISDPPLKVRHLSAIRTRAYARVLHPLSVADAKGFGALWRWSQLRASPISPDMGLHEVLAKAVPLLSSEGLNANPEVGQLNHVSTTTLATLISDLGLACATCHFYFWDGLGIFKTPGPYLYRGSVASVGCFFRPASLHSSTYSPWWRFQSPTLWWCEESWFVATHPDATSTYVGGPRSLVDGIVRHSTLEAMPVNADAVVDDWLASSLRAPEAPL